MSSDMTLLRMSQYVAYNYRPDIRDIVRRRRLGLFGHVARFDHDVPAASALAMCCDTKDFTPPDWTWRRSRGRPRYSWLRQICKDTDMSATDALTLAQDRDLRRAVAIRPPRARRTMMMTMMMIGGGAFGGGFIERPGPHVAIYATSMLTRLHYVVATNSPDFHQRSIHVVGVLPSTKVGWTMSGVK